MKGGQSLKGWSNVRVCPNPHPPLLLQENQIKQIRTKYSSAEPTKYLVLTVVSILCIVGVLLASTVVYCLRHRSHHKLKEKLTNLGTDAAGDATATYQVGGATAGDESRPSIKVAHVTCDVSDVAPIDQIYLQQMNQ